MEATSSRMRLRKRSSTDSVDSMRLEPQPPTGLMLGRTKLDLPHTSGRTSFYLVTVSKGRGSLSHYLSGLHKLERYYREVELLVVGGCKVKGWSHTAVSSCLQRHFGHVTSATDCKMVLKVTDHCGRRHMVEIQFELLYEDGVGDKARAAYDVIIRVVDSIITKPDVTDVMFEQWDYIRVRHGAMTGCFLRVGNDNTLCMDVPGTSIPDNYMFKCFKFFGHNQTACRRGRGRCPRRGGGGGGGGGSWPQLCVLQDTKSFRFVMASAMNHRLMADVDGGLPREVERIQKPDPRFFIMHPSGEGDPHLFCLRPLILCNWFLRYDAVEGLKLERCDPPPYQDPFRVRHFAFEFVPVHHTR